MGFKRTLGTADQAYLPMSRSIRLPAVSILVRCQVGLCAIFQHCTAAAAEYVSRVAGLCTGCSTLADFDGLPNMRTFRAGLFLFGRRRQSVVGARSHIGQKRTGSRPHRLTIYLDILHLVAIIRCDGEGNAVVVLDLCLAGWRDLTTRTSRCFDCVELLRHTGHVAHIVEGGLLLLVAIIGDQCVGCLLRGHLIGRSVVGVTESMICRFVAQ